MPPDEERNPIEDEQETPQEVVEEQPTDVLPPDEMPAEEPPERPQEDAEPSAADLKARVEALEAENRQLKEATPAEEPAPAAAPGQRVTMAQVFIQRTIPDARKQYAAAKGNPARQFEVMAETANLLVGAVMADQVTPHLQQLAAANVLLANELEIRDLRADPEFKKFEPDVRKRLATLDWKVRAGTAEAPDPVAAVYHQLRGAQRNGPTAPPAKPWASPSGPTRAALRDLAVGGGASPKPTGIRLTKEQETDYQGMVDNGIALTRTEYYAKLKSRQDQAKAAGKKIPATYRG